LLPSGLINPISVRKQINEDTGEEQYVLVDGAHRLAACNEAKFTEIACNVMDVNELDALFAQMIGNACKQETKPYEFARQCKRALAVDPALTIGDLAKRSRFREDYIRKLLKLDKLLPAVGGLVDKGTIDLMSAMALSKVPEDAQADWAEKAITAANATEFVESVTNYSRERKKAEAEGRDPNEIGFVMSPKLRKMAELKEVLGEEKAQTVKAITKGLKSADAAGLAVLNWVLQMDPESESARKATYEANIAKRQSTKEKNKSEAKAKLLAKKEADAEKLRKEIAADKNKNEPKHQD